MRVEGVETAANGVLPHGQPDHSTSAPQGTGRWPDLGVNKMKVL